MTLDPSCPFCQINASDEIHSDTLIRCIYDRHPVSQGHALVIPRRHVESWFELSPAEHLSVVSALNELRRLISAQFAPQGFNIGVNCGAVAGQTIPHAHMHLIPRYLGDVADPLGGVRGVIPGASNYLAAQPRLDLPHKRALITGASDPLLPHLVAHIAHASAVDIGVAFAMRSGVTLLLEHLRDVLARTGRVRLLVGDYLGVTEPDALRALLDLGPALDLRVFQGDGVSFHLKTYICRYENGAGTAFVGSSNLSQSALKSGIEWNYRVLTTADASGFQAVTTAFEDLLQHPRTRTVTEEWIQAYERRRPADLAATALPPDIRLPPEPPLVLPEPHEIQREALAELKRTREEGNQAGLVVLATGLGKTWLSAFDTLQAGAQRVLFVAHREEILEQAIATFRQIRPHSSFGRYTGTERTTDADVTFASVQTLSRANHLTRFAPDTFDYVIVDEFHHASAATYRRLIEHFAPRFLLGLTATPERTDGADLLALCGENLVYRADIADGIRRGLLSQFDYFGVPDEVDYEQIPWRNNRFDEEALTTAVATRTRADNALEQWQKRGGTKSLGFCVSQQHADFMADHFSAVGVRAVAVHSGPSTAPRALSLEQLKLGELDIVFSVDMFNEGVDLPDVDTVLMLRPTESAIVWTQQFGRGLRWRPGKRLKVIDYIGNHRSFLLKPRVLFQLDSGDAYLREALQLIEEGRMEALLPPGCSATYELEAKQILEALLQDQEDPLQDFYRSYKERTGTRPTAVDVYHAYNDPKSRRRGYGSWFQYVRVEGDLTGAHDDAEVRLREFLSQLETTPMTRSFKMVVLLAYLAESDLTHGVEIAALMAAVRRIVRRSAVLRSEFGEDLEGDGTLQSLLERNPIQAWTEGRGTGNESYFRYEASVFSFRPELPAELRAAGRDLIRELAEWRLAAYQRRAAPLGPARFTCRLDSARGAYQLFLPSRTTVAGLPESWIDITVDERERQARLSRLAVESISAPDDDRNELPSILEGWFGPPGEPAVRAQGDERYVDFVREGERYRMAPAAGAPTLGPRLWASYPRKEVPELFGHSFQGMETQSGVFERPGLFIFFVTLDKDDHPEEHRYADAFLSATDFFWLSQNRTAQASAVAARIRDHERLGISVHLFVRRRKSVKGKTQPVTYFGQLQFVRWQDEKPIKVWWKLKDAVPQRLWKEFKVPPGQTS
jgi:superfamily II DNA or RNA helicase/HKD family nuclease/diadenosine tetraphosphate (Ap4A) HIT family hydrolase